MAWRQMRHGIADLHRRAEVSRKAAFATVDEDTSLEEPLRAFGQPRRWRGHRVRALRPFRGDSRCQPGKFHLEWISQSGFTSHLLSVSQPTDIN